MVTNSAGAGPRTYRGYRETNMLNRLANLATRGMAGPGADAMVAGFVVRGPSSRTVLIRAVGPGLTNFGVTDAATDTTLRLYRGRTPLRSNDSWDAGGDSGPSPLRRHEWERFRCGNKPAMRPSWFRSGPATTPWKSPRHYPVWRWRRSTTLASAMDRSGRSSSTLLRAVGSRRTSRSSPVS